MIHSFDWIEIATATAVFEMNVPEQPLAPSL
jgi:hypothetical protein